MVSKGISCREPERESALSATRALCHTCGQLTDAKVVLRGGRVYLVKWCLEHGRSESLVSSDASWYLDSLAYVKPGTVPLQRAVQSYSGCPDSCGLCPAHEQHTCVPLLEITGRCNLSCPICLVDRDRIAELSVQQVQRIVDDLCRYEGELNMLTLSGGEPTLHPDLLAVVQQARRPEIGILSLSTNGIALADNPDLIKALRDQDVVIALQFDGVEPATYETLRGRADLGDVKKRIIDAILAHGARMSLTFTLARGVNEGELGRALELLFGEDQVVSMMVQPLACTRAALPLLDVGPADAAEPITIPEVVSLLCGASAGALQRTDFTPLPCSHPSCFALTYLLSTEGGGYTPLPRVLRKDVYIDVIKNQALMSTDPDTLGRVKDALYELWSSSGMVPNRDAVLRAVKQLLLDLDRLRGTPSHRDVLGLGAERIKSIFIHQFMDRTSFDLSRAIKCCNHYPQVDGRLLPACVRNVVAPQGRVAG